MVSKEQNLGGRAYVVDSIKEIRPKSSNIISRLNGSINSVVQNNNQNQDQIIKNFSLLIEGDTTIGYKIADDGKTIINETTLKAVVTYRRGIGAMQVTSIPDSDFKWVSFDTNKVVATGSTAVLSTPSTYIVSVDTEFLLSSVEPSQTNTIQLKLNTSVSIQYGTISLYTYSDAETRDELLLSLDNLRWYTNPYDIERDAKFIWRKDSSDGGKTWLYFRMEYEGPQGPTGEQGQDGKPAPNTIVEYQYSDSDREAPLKYIPFIFGGSRVNFKGGSIGDMNDEDWMANPPKKGKYKWMRVSTNGGKTWTYSVVTGPEPSFFEIESSKDEFRQNERGVVDKEDTLKFWVIRRNIPNESKTNWVVTPSSLLPNQALIHDDEIIINVPVGFKDDSFTVSASIGMYSEVLSKTITGVAQGTSTPKKLRTIDRSLEPPEPFPTTLEDGLSPIEDGDYLLVKIAYTDESSKERETALIPYRYYADIDQSTGLPMGWRPSDNSGENHSEIMANCLQEVLAGPQTVPSFSAYYGFFQSLVANDAFIKFLSSEYINIKGAIYGGGYDKEGNNKTGQAGTYISSKGLLKATRADISGKLACFTEQGQKIFETDALTTDYEVVAPTPYMCNLNDIVSFIDNGKEYNIEIGGFTYYTRYFKQNVLTRINENAYRTSITIGYECTATIKVSYSITGIGSDKGIDVKIISSLKGIICNIENHKGTFENSYNASSNESFEIRISTNDGIFQSKKAMLDIGLSVGQVLIYDNINASNKLAFRPNIDNLYTSSEIIVNSFNSKNFLKYSSFSFLIDSLNKGLEFAVSNSTLTVDGVLINAKSAIVYDNSIRFTLTDGTIKEYYSTEFSDISKYGYRITGAMTLKASGLGIRVSGILPISNDYEGIIGTKDKRFVGFFNRIDSTTINQQGTQNTVWGAVAN